MAKIIRRYNPLTDNLPLAHHSLDGIMVEEIDKVIQG